MDPCFEPKMKRHPGLDDCPGAGCGCSRAYPVPVFRYRLCRAAHTPPPWLPLGQPGARGAFLARPRGQYLPLLELAVAEDPDNDRNIHYLGREYFFHGNWDAAISTLKRHLQLPSATWADERCASMRYIAKCYVNLQNYEEAQRWFLRAVAQAPHLREPWLDFAVFAYENQDWYLLLWLTGRALAIQERPRTYITEAASWGTLPDDLASLGYFYTGQYEKALLHVNRALEIEPANPRLLKNREWILPFVTIE